MTKMNPEYFCILVAAITSVIVLSASIYDYRYRRIPNILTLSAILIGILSHVLQSGWSGLYFSFSGLALGIGLLFVPYLMGGIGAGDVKLLGAAGALLGHKIIFVVFVITAIVGGFMAVGTVLVNKSIARNKVLLNLERMNADQRLRLATSSERFPKNSIPYGIAIASGTIITLIGW